MSVSTNNAIPFVPENTIDPAAGLNEAINTIDVLLQLAVLTVNTNTPPAAPVAGDRHVVGTAPTGLWAGQAGKVARFLDGYWSFFSARYALNQADGKLYLRSAGTWAAASGGGGVDSVNGRTGPVTLDKTDVGLTNADNTSDANKPVSNPQATALALKVDKVAGLQLSQESYTTTEKTKLAGLDPNHFRGMFATLAALQSAVPTANIGDYAFVDPSNGTDVIQYLWDNNDSKWVYNGPTAGVTAAQVKTLYESNANTNAYTDAEKSKLDGVAAGAQVNTVTSVAGRAGAVVLAKADVGLGNVDNTADSAKPVSTAQQAALDAKVSIATDQVVTGLKTLTNQLVIQSGAGIGSLKIGADVNNNTLTDNIRKLARIVVPPRVASLPNWTLLAGDTTDNAGVNEVYFGGAPGSSIGGATSVSFYTAPTQAAGAGTLKWVIGADGNLVPGGAALYDLGSTSAPIRAVVAAGPIRPGQYTLTTLPSASSFNGYEIDVTNSTVAPAGSKRCRSNGTNWLILNTNTPVS